jgi:hypothetical protein
MRSLTELPEEDLKMALEAVDALMRHRAFMPRGGLLLMMLSRLRDDIREILGIPTERAPERGKKHRTLDEMTTTELATVSGAVAALLEVRLTANMDDPTLLDEFNKALTEQKAEREQLRMQVAS